MIRVGLTPCQIKECVFSQTCRKIGTLSKTSTLIAPSNSDHWSQLEWLNLAKQALLTYQLVDSEWALSQAKQCPGADPSMFRQLELEVVLYIKQRRGNLAMHTCTQMLQHYPRFAADPVGVSNLGAVLSLNKDFRHAQELLEQVPRDHPVWLDQAAAWLAETYVSLGKSHVAESIMEEVCKKYDSFKDREFETEARSNLQSSDDYSRTAWLCISVKNRQLWGGILLQNNKIDDAIEVLECTSQKAFRFLGDGNVIAHNVHNMLGLAYGFAKKYEKAVECLIPSLNWLQGYLEFPDRNLVNGWKVTAMYLHQMARNQEALEASRHAQRICRRLLENRRATGIDVQTQSELEIEITKTNIAVARAHIKLQQYQEALQILSTLQTTGATASKLDKEIYLMQAIVQHALSRVQK